MPSCYSSKGSPGPLLYLSGAGLHGLIAAGHARGRVAAPAQRAIASEMPRKVHESLDTVRQFPRILDLRQVDASTPDSATRQDGM